MGVVRRIERAAEQADAHAAAVAGRRTSAARVAERLAAHARGREAPSVRIAVDTRRHVRPVGPHGRICPRAAARDI